MKYLVTSKGDDYGANRMEIVEVTEKIAKQYYSFTKIPAEDFDILAKYIYEVDAEDEAERTDENRYYGN
jgi:hypothetical protein